MAVLDDLASKLFGSKRAESNIVSTDATTRTYVGTATSASEDGSVYVALSQDATLPDDDDGEHGIGVEMPTTVGVSEGDEVIVTLMGGGTMKSPVVTGNPGWGDNVQAQVDNAETLAQQAEAVATATGQHFWPDTDGVHVTEVTQEDWNDSTSPNYHSGANVLLNALGQLFRDGLNNILAIVSGTDPGIAIYDGSGNSAENILALLTKSLIRLGGRFAASGRSTAKVQFFEDDSALTDLTAEHYIDTTTEPQVSHDLALSSTITDDELPDGTSRTVTGNVEVWEQIHNDGSTYSDEVTASLNGATTNRQNNASVGVSVIEASGGQVERTAFVVADTLRLTYGTGEQTSVNGIPLQQAIVGLTQPSGTYTGTNTTSTAASTGWRITWFNNRIAGTACNFGENYYKFSNGVVTLLKACILEFSGVMNWTDSVAGNRGFGIWKGSSTVGSGREWSAFQMFPSGTNTRKSVILPPIMLPCTAGEQLAIGRYEQAKAVYVNGSNFSWITIRVVEDRSS